MAKGVGAAMNILETFQKQSLEETTRMARAEHDQKTRHTDEKHQIEMELLREDLKQKKMLTEACEVDLKAHRLGHPPKSGSN